MTTAAPSPMDVIKAATDGTLIEQYLLLRESRKKIEEEAKAKISKLAAVMGLIETQLSERLSTQHAHSVSSDLGTAFMTQKTSATISDPGAFRGWVITNQQWDIVDWRANVPGVVSYAEQHETVPPGLNMSSVMLVQIRKR